MPLLHLIFVNFVAHLYLNSTETKDKPKAQAPGGVVPDAESLLTVEGETVLSGESRNVRKKAAWSFNRIE